MQALIIVLGEHNNLMMCNVLLHNVYILMGPNKRKSKVYVYAYAVT